MEKLSQVASLSKTAQILINDLSERQRYRHRTDLRKMFTALESEHKNVDKKEFMEAFKMLQDLGIGSIVHGRGTTPTRFLWNYNLRDVGLVAKGKMKPNEMQQLLNGKPVEPQLQSYRSQGEPRMVTSVTPSGDAVTMMIVVPGGNVEHFRIPGDRVQLIRQLLNEFAEN